MKLTEYIDNGWNIVHALMSGVWLQLQEGKIIRRMVLGIAAYLQYKAIVWAMVYATTLPAGTNVIDAAAMVAAILTPISGLFAAAIKFYSDGRKHDNTQEQK